MATPSPAGAFDRTGNLTFCVQDKQRPVGGATCSLYQVQTKKGIPGSGAALQALLQTLGAERRVDSAVTDAQGIGRFDGLAPGSYLLVCHHEPRPAPLWVDVEPGCTQQTCLELGLNLSLTPTMRRDDCEPVTCGAGHVGDSVELFVDYDNSSKLALPIEHPDGSRVDRSDPRLSRWTARSAGTHELSVAVGLPYVAGAPGAPADAAAARVGAQFTFDIDERNPQPVSGNLGIALSRATTAGTDDVAFWQGILNSTEQMSFNNYLRFMNLLFCGDKDLTDVPEFERERMALKEHTFRHVLRPKRLLPFTDSDSYRAIKAATEAFVMVNCGVLAEPRPFDERRDRAYLRRRDLPLPQGRIEDVFSRDYLVQLLGGERGDKTLPYLAVIRSKLPDIAIKLGTIDADPVRVDQCHGILQDKLTNPCLLELIWTYWHEEGMVVQTMNSITRRFQNVPSSDRDPLANLEIDPLRALNNVLWGFVQDEQHRLSVVRRNYEYDHQYGLRLEGKAVQRMRGADSRSRFLEAFHNLMRLCAVFFKQDDDTTVKADAFPVLNALKEVHLILSQGAGNQFGDLTSTSRIELMMQQWMLARPEFREFLPTRVMTAYPEPWMDRVDAMKKLKGWTDTSVLHFRNLAVFGEQVLLSIRWGHWSDVQEPLQAFNWARFFRPQIQGYTHAYRAATGVDLSADAADAKVDATLPSLLMRRRQMAQQAGAQR